MKGSTVDLLDHLMRSNADRARGAPVLRRGPRRHGAALMARYGALRLDEDGLGRLARSLGARDPRNRRSADARTNYVNTYAYGVPKTVLHTWVVLA